MLIEHIGDNRDIELVADDRKKLLFVGQRTLTPNPTPIETGVKR
jgi:hypothetical protein